MLSPLHRLSPLTSAHAKTARERRLPMRSAAVAIALVTPLALCGVIEAGAAGAAGASPAAVSPVGQTPTGLSTYTLSSLSGGVVPDRPAVVSVDLSFKFSRASLAYNGVPYGTPPVTALTASTHTYTSSWLIDFSMSAGKQVTLEVTASNGNQQFDQTDTVNVAGDPKSNNLSPAATGAGWQGPLKYSYPTPDMLSSSTLVGSSALTLVKNGDVRSRLAVTSSGYAVTADSAVDAGVASSQVVGAVGSATKKGPSRVVVSGSTVSGSADAAVNGSVYVTGSYLTSDQDGVHPLGQNSAQLPNVIQYSRLQRGGVSTAGTNGYHNDGIQMWKGSNVVISRNWISGWATSALMLKSDQANSDGTPLNHVTIDGNYLATSGFFTINDVDGGNGMPQYITITNNVFGPNRTNQSTGYISGSKGMKFVRTAAERTQAVRDGVAGAAAWVVWSGNTSAQTGAEITPPVAG